MKDITQLLKQAKEENWESLDIGDCNLDEIPKEVFALENLKLLRARKNKIKNIPTEISRLKNLVELNLIQNEISEIPDEISLLENLEVLLIGKNKISEIPESLCTAKKLRVLHIRDNKLTFLPENIGKIKTLHSLFLKDNSITSLPNSISQLFNLKELMVIGNPIEYPPQSIITQGLMRIMMFFILEQANNTTTGFTFTIPKEMRTAVKQYLTYFPEYVEIAKGKTIKFEVKSSEDGISIETSEADNLEELNEFFNEYLGFVKNNLDDLQPKIHIEIQETRKDLFLLELKSQVQHFKQQIEFKNFQIKYLEKQIETFQNILVAQNSRPLPIYINALAQSSSKSEAQSEQNVNVITEFKIELPKIQSESLLLKELLPVDSNEYIKQEISLLDEELMGIDVNDIEDVDKKPFKRIKRLFDQVSDEDSEISKIFDKSIKFKQSLQKIGKSYNKVAQWLALPHIPDILLEL